MKDLVTEAEAYTKWCPFVKAEAEKGYANNRASSASHCCASACMFWRWSKQDTGPSDQPTGFCGAAGLPRYT